MVCKVSQGFLFNQKGLQDTKLPASFGKFVKNKKEDSEEKTVDLMIAEPCETAIKELIDSGIPFDHIDIITYVRKQLRRSTNKAENRIIEHLIPSYILELLPSNYTETVVNTSMSCEEPVFQYLYSPKGYSSKEYIGKNKTRKQDIYGLTREKRVQVPVSLIKSMGDVQNVVVDYISNPTYILVFSEEGSHDEDACILNATKVRISSTMMKDKYNFVPSQMCITQDEDGMIKISPPVFL